MISVITSIHYLRQILRKRISTLPVKKHPTPSDSSTHTHTRISSPIKHLWSFWKHGWLVLAVIFAKTFRQGPGNYKTLMILQWNNTKSICFLNYWGWGLKIIDGNFPCIISRVMSILFLMYYNVTIHAVWKRFAKNAMLDFY